MNIIEQSVEPIWFTPNPETVIEQIGRVCYKSEDKITHDSAGFFIRRLIERGHDAMLEHASASFKIITDRGISHEIVRHRIASFAQESTRYCNYAGSKFGGGISVVEPIGITHDQREIWIDACLSDETDYLEMLENGCTPQIARAVLPTSLKTEIVMTANLREWRHFIKLRAASAAHPQIRPIAMAIHGYLMEVAPSVFEDLIV